MLRAASDGMADVVGSSHNVGIRASIWRGSLLAMNLPVVDGSLDEDGTKSVPETLSLTIAFMDGDGVRYANTGRGQNTVIGSDGHRVHLVYTIDRGDGVVLACPLGWYLIQSWQDNGDGTLTLDCVGLLQIIKDYGLLTPTAPPAGATLKSEVLRLIEGFLPVAFTGTDRAAPVTFAWTQDRLGAIEDIATAGPYDLRVDASAVLDVTDSASVWAADLVLTEGVGGTIMPGTGKSGSRDGVVNAWVVQGAQTDDPSQTPYLGIAKDDNLDSPTNVWAFGPVVGYYASPLMITAAQCAAAAATLLAKSLASASNIPVTCLPDPRITFGTRIELHRADGTVTKTVVVDLTLPLTASGGPMSLTLGVVA